MNLKLKAFGLVAAIAMCLGLAGTASADQYTPIVISMTDSGSFALNFGGTVPFTTQEGGPVSCNPLTGLYSISTTSFQDRTDTGTLCLVYTDSLAYRAAFHVDLQATNFESYIPVPYPGTGTYVIPAANLKVTENHNPAQMRWTSMNGTWGFPIPTNHVGDMGDTTSAGVYSSHDEAWSSNNSLNVAKTVTIAFGGTGTVGTLQAIDVSLLVPGALPGGTYTSTLTATLYWTATLP